MGRFTAKHAMHQNYINRVKSGAIKLIVVVVKVFLRKVASYATSLNDEITVVFLSVA